MSKVVADRTSHVKKIAVVGPECTGKTELSKYLAETFETCWVAEYARAYLDNLARPYEQSDLTKIAHAQIRLEDEWLYEANRVLICDTTLEVIKIWSEFKYGNCDKEIIDLMQLRNYDLYLLTYIDIPWQEDPQREHPDKREQLWAIYEKEFADKSPVVLIKGEKQQRRATAMNAVKPLLSIQG
ncbi:MAG: AAA family ATPase [Cyclobacteriaceae bacterium]